MKLQKLFRDLVHTVSLRIQHNCRYRSHHKLLVSVERFFADPFKSLGHVSLSEI